MNENKVKTRLVIIPLLVVTMSVVISSILLVLFYEKYFNDTLDGNYNTFCQDQEALNLGPAANGTLDYLICKNPAKRKSFFWIQLDGVAYNQLIQIQKELVDDVYILKANGPAYRQSGAMHESFFTGRMSRNFIGYPIKGDNLAYQLQQSKSQQLVELIGSWFPLKTLIGDYLSREKLIKEENGVFRGMCGIDDFSKSVFLQRIVHQDGYDFNKMGVHFNKTQLLEELEEKTPYIIEPEQFEKLFTQCLIDGEYMDAEKHTNHSTIYYSAYTDGLNHAYSKAHAMNVFSFFRLNKIIIQVMKYFMKHFPEIPIFVSSDHGGQYFNGEDNFCNHGCATVDNQGIFLIASAETKGKGHLGETSYLDIVPTITQFLEGVNLPLFNRGIAYPIQKGVFEHELLPLHSRYIQLQQYFKKVGTNSKKSENENLSQKYGNILKTQDSLSDIQKNEILEKYRNTVDTMQEQLNESERSKKDFRLIYFLEFLLLASLGCIFYFNRQKINAAVNTLTNPQILWICITVVFYYTENILVLWLSTLGASFFIDSFYLNMACVIILYFFFSFFEFGSQTLEQMREASIRNDSGIQLDGNFKPLKYIEANTCDITDGNINTSNAQSLPIQATSPVSQPSNPSFFKNLLALPERIDKYLDRIMTVKRCLLLILLIEIVCRLFVSVDMFVVSKKMFMETLTKIDSLTIFNYTIAITCYFLPKAKLINVSSKQYVFYAALYSLMIYYDLIDLRYLIIKTPAQVFLTRFITFLVFSAFFYNFYRAYSLLNKNKQSAENAPASKSSQDNENIFTYLQFDISVFVFYIADEIERLYLIMLFFTLIYSSRKINKLLSTAQFTDKKGILNPLLISFFVSVLIFKNLQMIFSAFKGTLSLEINLQSGNKTIGAIQDQTPFYTATLFGIDKMLIYIFGYIEISAMFLRISMKKDGIKFSKTRIQIYFLLIIFIQVLNLFLLKIQSDDASKSLLACLSVKILLTGFQQCLNFFDEESFMSLFFWYCSTTVIMVISFLPYAGLKTIYGIRYFLDFPSRNKQQQRVSL